MASEATDLRFSWNVVELCAGGGGMSTGIEAAGLRLRAAAELDPDMAAIHAVNHPTTRLLAGPAGDIRTLSGKTLLSAAGLKKGELDVLAGGIPCQGFSMNGERRKEDPRNSLWREVPRLASETGARMVVVENVPGMESLADGAFLQGLLGGLEDAGYQTTVLRVNASQFGVPQHRRRIIIVGAGAKATAPPSHETEVGVWQAIKDLPEGPSGDPATTGGLPYVRPPTEYSTVLRLRRRRVKDCGVVDHARFLVDRFKCLRAGERDEPTRHRRLHPNKPSHTMLAGAKTITACRPVHPFKDRVLTVREGARLFGYPDSYQFGPTVQKSWYALGNSVPPPLAAAVFGHLGRTLLR